MARTTFRLSFLTPNRAVRVFSVIVFSLASLCSPSLAQLGEEELWYDGPAGVDPAGTPVAAELDVDDQGRTVVVWEIPGGFGEIYARRFGHDGTALEDPILVASVADSGATGHREPSVAASPDGDFLVVWTEVREADARGVDIIEVRSRHYDANGQPTGSEQIVNSEPATFPAAGLVPDVAALSGGGFAVVWVSFVFPGGADNGSTSIQGRIVSNAGIPSGDQFLVNVVTPGAQTYPRVDGLPEDDPDGPYDGGFVVAWAGPDIHVRRFTAGGVGEPSDHLVDGTENGERIDVAAQQYGAHVAVTWHAGSSVHARVFDGDLDPVGPAIEVSGVGDTNANWPSITDIGRDGFYLSWESATGVGNDNSQASIQARILDQDGAPVGSQFQVNTWIQNGQSKPNVGSSVGRLGIVWQSSGRSVDDMGGAHLLGYLLDYCDLFCDDFESGDVDLWSASHP